MKPHQVSVAHNLANRRQQSPLKPKLTKIARLSIVNVSLNNSEHLSELKRLHIITISNQGSQLFPVSLNLYLQLFNSPDQKEIGIFTFLEQPSQTSFSPGAFDVDLISTDRVAFIFIKLKPNYFFSEMNVNNSSNKISIIFSQIEFPGICFKTPDKFLRYFDEIAQSILSKQFCPQKCIYSIKTEHKYLFRENELVSELIMLQRKNQNRELNYIINYKNSVSQRSTEENSSEEERRTPESETKHQSSSRIDQVATSSQSRRSDPRLSKDQCREYLSKCSNAVHQGSGSYSNKSKQVQPKSPENLKTEDNSYNRNYPPYNQANFHQNNKMYPDSQESLKTSNLYQSKEASSTNNRSSQNKLDAVTPNRSNSHENRFNNVDISQRNSSFDKYNSASNSQAQVQTNQIRGNSEPRTNKVEQPRNYTSSCSKNIINSLQEKKFKIPAGLRNIGLSCFMNAILEALFMTLEFISYFLNKEYLQHKQNKEKEGLADIFAKVLMSVKNPNHQASSLTDLKKLETYVVYVGKTNPTFLLYGQHDAYEFFKGLLEGINTELNRVKNPLPYKILKVDPRVSLQASSDEWFNYLNGRENSIVSDLFCGQLMNETVCSVCNHKKFSFEPYWDLSLSFQKVSLSKEKQNLETMLEHFLAPQEITGFNLCDRCQRQTKTKLRHVIWRLPKILVFHLRRFEGGNGIYRKLHTEVVFPVRDLDLSLFAKESADKSAKMARYSLYSIVEHHGKNLTNGHYTAKCLSPDDEDWYRFNDSNVNKSRIGFDESSSDSACILFYARK